MGELEELGLEVKKVKSVSVQGFQGKPDFPKIDIHVPDDKREMET